ncbi:MAG: hypothetical protein ACRDPY_26615 [Streptosporangiaceae bacterium]
MDARDGRTVLAAGEAPAGTSAPLFPHAGFRRGSLARLLPAEGLPAAPVIGGYWTRSNDVEIDIVGADRESVAKQLLFLGSVKWLQTGPTPSSPQPTW